MDEKKTSGQLCRSLGRLSGRYLLTIVQTGCAHVHTEHWIGFNGAFVPALLRGPGILCVAVCVEVLETNVAPVEICSHVGKVHKSNERDA